MEKAMPAQIEKKEAALPMRVEPTQMEKKEYLSPLLRVETDKKPFILSFGRGGMGGCG